MAQIEISFDHPTGAQLRDYGIKTAVDHADAFIENWSDTAFNFLLGFIKRQAPGTKFMCEEVRALAEQSGIEVPPSNRAYGGLIVRAARIGLIKKAGTQNVKNVKNVRAHMANANVWLVM